MFSTCPFISSSEKRAACTSSCSLCIDGVCAFTVIAKTLTELRYKDTSAQTDDDRPDAAPETD